MELHRRLIVRDFNEHLVPDASGKRIQLYQFDASPFQPQDFKVIFHIKTTSYSSVDNKMIVIPKAKNDAKEHGNITHYEIIDVAIDKNLYIQVEKLIEITKSILPMEIRYQIFQ